MKSVPVVIEIDMCHTVGDVFYSHVTSLIQHYTVPKPPEAAAVLSSLTDVQVSSWDNAEISISNNINMIEYVG